jgi:hypothetical protein
MEISSFFIAKEFVTFKVEYFCFGEHVPVGLALLAVNLPYLDSKEKELHDSLLSFLKFNWKTYVILTSYTVNKVSDFPVHSRDVTNQILPGRELFN